VQEAAAEGVQPQGAAGVDGPTGDPGHGGRGFGVYGVLFATGMFLYGPW
jgi:hypothetical protein